MEGQHLNKLSGPQKQQVEKQLDEHHHERYKVDIGVSDNLTLKDFLVFPNVLRPERMSSKILATFLDSNRKLFQDKVVLDMGCGTGLQGIVTAFNNASSVHLVDISNFAVENAKANVDQYELDNCEVSQSDLFENVTKKFDLIIFNHPFFADLPWDEEPVTISMLDEGSLLQRFLQEAKKYLNEGGVLLLPYFEPAGETNNPEIQGLKHGYEVERVFEQEVDFGLQAGPVFITKLTLPNK